jgi:hypothetical protein
VNTGARNTEKVILPQIIVQEHGVDWRRKSLHLVRRLDNPLASVDSNSPQFHFLFTYKMSCRYGTKEGEKIPAGNSRALSICAARDSEYSSIPS